MKNNKKPIMVFGGCFNPPLYSHLSLAEQMLNEYNELEKIVFVPVNSKYEKVGLLSNEHRYEMLRLACVRNEKFDISRVEIDCDRQLYTIETLRKLQTVYPEHELVFLTGSDNLKELDTWIKADELVSEFKICVLQRGEDNIDEIIEGSEFLKSNKQSFIKAKNDIKSNLSSTFARDKIKNNKSIRYLTSDEIILYIKENKLYE